MDQAHHRILFVEPEVQEHRIFRAVLRPEENGWSLHFASSAAEALEFLRTEPADILITVHSLPDGTGPELCKLVKQESPETIRFLLIDQEEASKPQGLICAAQQVLTKPLELPEFIAQLQRSFALRDVVKNTAIRKLLGNADALPPLPRIFRELAMKLSDPGTSLHQIAEIISQDIVLSSKVLKLANSALFSLRTRVTSISQATTLLGSNIISSLTFSQSMAETFKSDHMSTHFSEKLNWHSLECAGLASDLIKLWGADRTDSEKAFFCGISHDLGKLMLKQYRPMEWEEAQKEITKGERPDVLIERETIGVGHPELAAYLLATWGFPTDQLTAIVFHHEPSRVPDPSKGLLCALHIAEQCCESPQQTLFLDHDYLTACGISDDDIEGFKIMYSEKQCEF